MLKGKVVLFDPEKYNGYVRLPDTLEIFFFQLDKRENHPVVRIGDWVVFRISQDKYGCRAVDLAPLSMS